MTILIDLQKHLELKYANQHQETKLAEMLAEFKDDMKKGITPLMNDLLDRELGEHDEMVHEALRSADLVELMFKVFINVTNASTSVQAVVGSIRHSFSDLDDGQQLDAASILIEHTPLLEVVESEKKGELLLVSEIEFEPNEREVLDNFGKALPSVAPMRELKTNRDTGYHTFKGRALCGTKLNYHDKEINLEHLNQRNKVAMKLDPEICGRMLAGKFKFDSTPRWSKDKGRYESKQDVEKRHEAWNHLHQSMPVIQQQLGKHTFYINHTKDARGRVYCSGYEVNYQGIDLQKAMVSLEKTVIIEPTF